MSTHLAPVPRLRISILVLALLALATLAVLAALPRIQVTASSSAPAMQRIAATPVVVQSQGIDCGRGAYVTGDMAGDASPSSVYAALCGTR